MESDLADAQEVKAAEESAWEILTGFSLPKYAVDSLTHYKNNPESFKNEVLSGITVAVMQVPESVAFSFVAGVPPLVGLYSTFFLGFITAVIGGKEGMISGAAGAMAVVIKDLMADSGPLSSYSKGDRFNHLLMTVLVCGILQTLCGLFQLAKLVKLISKPCMVGFMNGLGIVIFYAQFGAFKKSRAVWKSTSELGYHGDDVASMAWKLHAIEQMQLRRRYRVDGVGRPKFDFHTGAAPQQGCGHGHQARLQQQSNRSARRVQLHGEPGGRGLP